VPERWREVLGAVLNRSESRCGAIGGCYRKRPNQVPALPFALALAAAGALVTGVVLRPAGGPRFLASERDRVARTESRSSYSYASRCLLSCGTASIFASGSGCFSLPRA
jgi:hypothetical protein